MTFNDDSAKLMKLILKECQELLKEIEIEAEKHDKVKYGIPPRSIIVKYHDRYEQNGSVIGKIISAWKLSIDKIEDVSDLECQPLLDPRSGMYYYEGNFLFSISSDRAHVILEWQIGPRYGRGTRYRISRNEKNELKMTCDTPLWVS